MKVYVAPAFGQIEKETPPANPVTDVYVQQLTTDLNQLVADIQKNVNNIVARTAGQVPEQPFRAS